MHDTVNPPTMWRLPAKKLYLAKSAVKLQLADPAIEHWPAQHIAYFPKAGDNARYAVPQS
jgi:hypothetical protein